MAKKIKIKEIKKDIKVKELGKELVNEELDESLTDEEIRLILAHKARLRTLQAGSGEVETGLKQDVSELERKAAEAPVSTTAVERPSEETREVKYSAPGGGSYDTKRHYDDANKYGDIDPSLAEERMTQDSRGSRHDRNPFSEEHRNVRDTYGVKEASHSDDGEKKKRSLW